MTALDQTADPALDVARALTGAPVDRFEPVGGGRNSRVYRVECGAQTYALKRYPSRADDTRDRLGTEVEALELMQRHRIPNVPCVLASDRERNYALLSWLEGSPVTAVDADRDVDAAATFLTAVHAMRNRNDPPFGRQAAEACLSGQEVEAQIRRRLLALQLPAASEPDLAVFLASEFTPALVAALGRARATMAAANLDFTALLPQEKQTLVPSDFGFHNSLRSADGTLVFFDFEYFGWDDPVKLTADVLHHPGTPVDAARRQRFRDAALGFYGDDATFRPRLDAMYPLFGLRWVLILLNEFLPERWRLRVSAGETKSWAEAKARQLSSARALLERVVSPKEGLVNG